MNRKKLFKLSLVTLGIAAFLFAFNYYFYHYFTSSGFTLTYHKLPEKPFVSDLIGQFAVLFLFTSAISSIIALVCFEKE